MRSGLPDPRAESRRLAETTCCRWAAESALLALLVLHANKVVSGDRLIDALWGERPRGHPGTVSLARGQRPELATPARQRSSRRVSTTVMSIQPLKPPPITVQIAMTVQLSHL